MHGHWCLVRLLRAVPGAPFESDVVAALRRSFTPANLAGELAYLRGEGRGGFERPYGLAWLLQLAAELREWDAPEARAWHAALAPLEALAIERIAPWLPKLPTPIRSGEHSQTAFALGLVLDWARVAGERRAEEQIGAEVRRLYLSDVGAPLAYEPSGHDFLSPILGEADLLRRVIARADYGAWLDRFLPDLDSATARRWLAPVTSPDPADGKLSHLDGLNLSRAWMLEGIASALDGGGARVAMLRDAAQRHADAGLAAVTGEHYAGAHWLGSFAVYLLTGRGLA